MGARSGGGASGGIGSGTRDYLAEAGITMGDVMKVMKTSLTKNAPTNEQIVKKKIAKMKKDKADKEAFNFLLGNIEAGLKKKNRK